MHFFHVTVCLSDLCLTTYSKCHEPLIVVDLFGVLKVISRFRCVCVMLELPVTFIHLSTCISATLSFDFKDFCGNLLRKFRLVKIGEKFWALYMKT